MSLQSLPPIDPALQVDSITKFIKQTCQQQQFDHVIVAVSGGIDSSISLKLSVMSLGPKAVYALHLPTKHSNPIHSKDVATLIENVGLPKEQLVTINIGSLVQKSWRLIKQYTSPITISPAPQTPNRSSKLKQLRQENLLRLANLTARIRMMLLYDQAKRYKALVVGTENYTEHLLGYFTRFGDEASDIEPLKHLYKSQIFTLASYLNLPKEIVTKQPTADLWPGQDDQSEIGVSYQLADQILHHLVHHLELPLNDPKLTKSIALIRNRFEQNQFKHQVPYTLTQ